MDAELEAAWAALLARTGWPGVYGVASTKNYCNFGCPSRAPLRANFRLFTGSKEAEIAGFRPCKRCQGRSMPHAQLVPA